MTYHYVKSSLLVQPNVSKEKHNSPQKLDDIDGKVNAVGKSVEKKIDMISTYLIRYFFCLKTEFSLLTLLIFRMNNKIEALAKGGGGGSRLKYLNVFSF